MAKNDDQVRDDGETLSLPLVGGPGKTFGEMDERERRVAILTGALVQAIASRDEMDTEYRNIRRIQDEEIKRLQDEIHLLKGYPV